MSFDDRTSDFSFLQVNQNAPLVEMLLWWCGDLFKTGFLFFFFLVCEDSENIQRFFRGNADITIYIFYKLLFALSFS